FTATFALVAASLAAPALLWAQSSKDEASTNLSFQQLEGKVSLDTAPLPEKAEPTYSHAGMLEEVMPAVVTIFSKREEPVNSQMQDLFNDPLFRRLFPDRMPQQAPRQPRTMPVTGSGVVISSDGYILTNNHVVEKSRGLEVVFDGTNEEYDAELIVADPKTDVALIKINATNLPTVTLGDSSHLRVGDLTFAIGNPFGLDQTVTMGIVSALGRSSADVGLVDYADFIQTDAAINRGNSGGALIDAKGRLVGINTAIQGGMSGGNIGIGFAIPTNMALEIVEKLLDGGGIVRRGFLGVELDRLDRDKAEALGWKENHGVLVAQVFPKTPAEKAGLKAYDIITSYQGVKAESPDTLRLTISNTSPDMKVSFGIFRDGKPINVDLKLAELPKNPAEFFANGSVPAAPKKEEFLEGVTIIELDEEMRSKAGISEDVMGVLVEEVDASSAAAEAGLASGMVILDVNQKSVSTVEEAMTARNSFQGNVLLLRVGGGGSSRILTVRVK
ncbi:MAG: Do family serine endopeptidase, partial [Verrucomicrobiota bacterium]